MLTKYLIRLNCLMKLRDCKMSSKRTILEGQQLLRLIIIRVAFSCSYSSFTGSEPTNFK